MRKDIRTSSAIGRRRFLQGGAAVGAVAVTGRSLLAQDADAKLAAEEEAAEEEVEFDPEATNFACIGVGGKGKSDSLDAGQNGNVVAICDVDKRTLEQAALRFPGAKKYHDYREMLTDMGDKIDAVTVSIPDHGHAAAALMAMRMGKHVFCQKPLTRTIYEARLMGEVAKEMGVKTQMGNQGTAESELRRGSACIKAGAIGTVKEVHIWTNRPVWPQGMERPPEGTAVPEHLSWEQWIGPAAFRPYHEAYHPFKWRGFWDFGTGALGDMGCHTINLPYDALELRDPVAVEASTAGHNKETYPGWSVVTFEFPARGDRPALKMYWYDGGKRPEELIDQEMVDWVSEIYPDVEDPHSKMRSGSLIVGDKGKFFSPHDYGALWKIFGAATPEVEFEESPGHFVEWVDAIEGGPEATSNFPNYAGPLTEMILLGNLAVWSGSRVEWDAKNMKVTNNAELNKLVKPTYRDGYVLDLSKQTAGA
jgi:predicted dehydrogenase